jgi:hypothetical protein
MWSCMLIPVRACWLAVLCEVDLRLKKAFALLDLTWYDALKFHCSPQHRQH